MCGISGEIRWDGRPADVAVVSTMTTALRRRGPDDQGVWSSGPIALGHRRLSIVDLSTHAKQPMIDAELGLSVVFNGCIYNHAELRRELEAAGYRFFSDGDTEVLVKAYHRWGTDFVHRLKGMFAFCIVERDTGRAVLGRDRLGIKPLYLNEDGCRLRFASSLPALLAAGDVDTTIDDVALHHYLTLHGIVPAPRTLFRGIRKLPPATLLTIDTDGAQSSVRYWEPTYERDPGRADMSVDDWHDAILDALRNAVKRRLVGDVPVGVLLSGGLDSSLIVALLAEVAPHTLETFSIGFDSAGAEQGNEFRYSQLIADRFSTSHHVINVSTSNIAERLVESIGTMSEPLVSHDSIAFFLLSEAVAHHVKVVQSGQGADEIFAGYYWHQPLAGASRAQAADVFVDRFFDRTRADLTTALADEHLLDGDVAGAFVAQDMARPGAETALDAVMRLDIHRLMPDDPLKRVDNMTMAWGLEARVPFLDHDLVELAAACPPELKLASGGKGVLKDAARRLLPSDVIDRPKGYFPVPAVRRVDGEIQTLVRDTLLSATAQQRGIFRPEYLESLALDPGSHRTASGANLAWQALLLELWLEEMLDDAQRVTTVDLRSLTVTASEDVNDDILDRGGSFEVPRLV